MPINIQLADDFFEDHEREKLEALFQAHSQEDFEAALQKIAHAALCEYKEMFLGRGLPTRADEIRQHRLFFLIKYYTVGCLPSEAEISSMFQLTQSRSRSLLRFVMTRFHYELEEETTNTLKAVLEKAEFDTETKEYRVVIDSDNVVEELNRVLERSNPSLDPVRKMPSTIRKFRISEDSYIALCNELGIEHSEGSSV